jgi:hypothetical protein
MARLLPQGRYHHFPNGSYLPLNDDQEVYFEGLLDFQAGLEQGSRLDGLAPV